MTRQSTSIRIDSVRGFCTFSNSCWACVLIFGALGPTSVGLSSHIGKDLIPLLPSRYIVFIPQGIVMLFHGLAGLFIGSYLGCAAFWDVGSGYNLFNKREGIFPIFRWGFPGRNCRICAKFSSRDIQAVGLETHGGLYPRRILYPKFRGRQNVPLTRIGENSSLSEIEEKAAGIARFLRVPIESFRGLPRN
uniref:photosystem I assembly protein Ycf4 n=1 Tax=Schizaea poeppigiana TaxID=148578 RepID=UPI002114DCFA|nr:photosystem I assembly protein Ycf4 [Schizaea poeppigiana]UTJ90414.1 photosystem I assembly protein Ycf4 [Schizaea poeppigiana]